MKKEIQENYESMKWNEQWEKAKNAESRNKLHEVFIDKIKDNRDYKQISLEQEKREQDISRNEEINSQLRLQYQNLISEKASVQKSLNLYKLIN